MALKAESTHPAERAARFAFGQNWQRYRTQIGEEELNVAIGSLQRMLGQIRLEGQTFLDIGCGSGLFSLSAQRLGAKVRSFDFDPDSVRCTEQLKLEFAPNASEWKIDQGSILDRSYLTRLGAFDVVYSWGVLHHTGAMWEAFQNVLSLVKPNGLLYIAIYNDEGWKSRVWYYIKKLYVSLPRFLRFPLVGLAFARMWLPLFVRDLLHGEFGKSWRDYSKSSRGMNPWRDVIDWVGGFPFEVASVSAVTDYFLAQGFQSIRVIPCGPRSGLNEFVFQRAKS